MEHVILRAEHLRKAFPVPGDRGRSIPAVDDVSLRIGRGEIVGLLGESGCGKSTLARILLGLTRPDSGTVSYGGRALQHLTPRQLRPLRRGLQMVSQNPFDSLDPARRVGALLEEPLKLWRPEYGRRQRLAEIETLLLQCGMDARCLKKTPPEFSGGQL